MFVNKPIDTPAKAWRITVVVVLLEGHVGMILAG